MTVLEFPKEQASMFEFWSPGTELKREQNRANRFAEREFSLLLLPRRHTRFPTRGTRRRRRGGRGWTYGGPGSGELRAGGRGGGDGSRRTECTAERPKGRTDGTDIITRRGEADERRQRSRRKKNSSHIEPRPAASGSIGTPRFVLVVYEILKEVHHPGGLICREGRRDQTKG